MDNLLLDYPITLSILFLLSVWFISSKWQYRLKMAFTYFCYMLSATLIIPLALFLGDRCALIWAYMLHPLSTVLGLRWKILGHEGFDRKKTYVVLCNHQSALDVLAACQVNKVSYLFMK